MTAQTSPPATLPSLGDASDLSLSAERRMGDRIARELYRDPDYLDDPVLVEYVQGIWQPLLAAARLRGELTPEMDERFAWEILLGRDRSVNAFALPGAYLGLHLGLIGVVSSRDELASVLAHELSHVTQRHISRLMDKRAQQTPWVIAGMILGTLAAAKNPDAGNAVVTGAQALGVQTQLNFSRDMEREADRVGYGVMTQAGFAPQGFVAMFEKLQQASRLNDNGNYPYLRSHPLTTERVADMQQRQQLEKLARPTVMTVEHAMMAARARVLSNPGVDTLRAMSQEANDPRLGRHEVARQAAVLYAAALASGQLREVQAAAAALKRLMALVHMDTQALRMVQGLAAELALAQGDATGAARALTQLTSLTHAARAANTSNVGSAARVSRPELLLRGQLTLLNGQGLPQAVQALQLWLADHARDALAWQQLSILYTAQGQTLRAIRASAENQVALLDYIAALDRFKAAQELRRSADTNVAVDHVDASIIDTRQRQVEALLKAQTLER